MLNLPSSPLYVIGGQVVVVSNLGGGHITTITPSVVEDVVVGGGRGGSVVIVGTVIGPGPVTVYGSKTQSVTVIAERVMTVVQLSSIIVTTG